MASMRDTEAQETTGGRDAASPQGLAGSERARRSEFRRSWNRFVRFKPGIVGFFFICFLVVMAIIPGVFEPYPPNEQATSLRGAGPSWDHPFGHDYLGRDILSRTIRGTRVALMVGISSMLISVVIGTTIGAVAGFFGGWVDSVLMRIVDALMAFPLLLLLIVLAAVLGPSLWMTIVIIGITIWSSYARVVRAEVLSLRERDFVMASRAAGSTDGRIIMRHIMPNAMGPVIVLATLSVGSIIILAAALSFLGFGTQPPTAAWGNMLANARPYIEIYPHMPIPPGVMIFLTVVAFNLVGDGLRDALDPRQRE